MGMVIYSIIMAENVLPKISPETRSRLESYGFGTNHLYDSLELPSCLVPRGVGFNGYTYLVMGLSIAGGYLAKRFGSAVNPFAVAFVSAPVFAFILKKEADFDHISDFSKRNPEQVLQNYPIMHQSFNVVKREVECEITRLQDRISLLKEEANKRQ